MQSFAGFWKLSGAFAALLHIDLASLEKQKPEKVTRTRVHRLPCTEILLSSLRIVGQLHWLLFSFRFALLLPQTNGSSL
jgi:hypothetical protein